MSCQSSSSSFAFQSSNIQIPTKPSFVYNNKQPSSLLNAFPNNKNSDESLSFESAVKNGWKPSRGTFTGLKRRHLSSGKTNTVRSMSDTNGAVMPDGGLSPCIIKVVGVGGGGCNAVSTTTSNSRT